MDQRKRSPQGLILRQRINQRKRCRDAHLRWRKLLIGQLLLLQSTNLAFREDWEEEIHWWKKAIFAVKPWGKRCASQMRLKWNIFGLINIQLKAGLHANNETWWRQHPAAGNHHQGQSSWLGRKHLRPSTIPKNGPVKVWTIDAPSNLVVLELFCKEWWPQNVNLQMWKAGRGAAKAEYKRTPHFFRSLSVKRFLETPQKFKVTLACSLRL